MSVTPSWTVSGGVGDQLGWSVAGAGDIDGDGYDDAIVGPPHHLHLSIREPGTTL
ncbi:MAG TPA: hypothetical protein VFV75_03760 [Candidatus Polarisedimenticolaceae bacterium]|nr:hypothetical protein [Candidatus Polarisedimenticolaceae bacterium]